MAINVRYQVPGILLGSAIRNQDIQDRRREEDKDFQRELLQMKIDASKNESKANFQRQLELLEKKQNGYMDYAQLKANLKRNGSANGSGNGTNTNGTNGSITPSNTLQSKLALQDNDSRNKRREQNNASRNKINEQDNDANNKMLVNEQEAANRMYSDGMKVLYELEKDNNYTPSDLQLISEIRADMGDINKKMADGTLSPREGVSAMIQLQRKRLAIRPTEPKNPDEKLTEQQRFDKRVVYANVGGQQVPGTVDKSGKFNPIYPPSDSTTQRSNEAVMNTTSRLFDAWTKTPEGMKASSEQQMAKYQQIQQMVWLNTPEGRKYQMEQRREQARQAMIERQRQEAARKEQERIRLQKERVERQKKYEENMKKMVKDVEEYEKKKKEKQKSEKIKAEPDYIKSRF